jgi:hypothetical protein
MSQEQWNGWPSYVWEKILDININVVIDDFVLKMLGETFEVL